MKIKTYRDQFITRFSGIYDADEAESFFYLILESKHQLKRVDLALYPDLSFSDAEIEVWDAIASQLENEIPIQYILGETSFYGLPFVVNSNVLIPRPETEELVEWILSDNFNTSLLKNLSVLDIGTGSGCIAIALAKHLPGARVFAVDVSEEALTTAKRNAEINEVAITFLHLNILETENLNRQFDIIVSNPPYVRNLEKGSIKNNVLQHEPHLALFVEDDDALLFYRKIIALAKTNLNPNGELYFEINQYLGKKMVDLMENSGWGKVALRKDIYGNDRMIRAVLINKNQDYS
ncbi:MAG TPA: peptide chain release factor N(5)-glutamine methyltransferase [Flavobacterium sp.]|jgi:release factor glutamine methyltransferase